MSGTNDRAPRTGALQRTLAMLSSLGLLLFMTVGCLEEVDDFVGGLLDPEGGFILGPDGAPIRGETLGGSCASTSDCRDGLVCEGGSCAAAGTSAAGELCTITDECGEGLICDAIAMQCVAAGSATENQACAEPSDCARGTRCELRGFTGVCVASTGETDIGGSCESNLDCADPLRCGETGVCKLPVFGGATFIDDRECAEAPEDEPFAVYFELPGQSDEFYRLPFPNDIRLNAEGIDLSDFPRPPLTVIGGDFVNRWIDDLGENLHGFSPVSAVRFRTNRAYDFDSVTLDSNAPTLRFINITEGSERYGNSPGAWGWSGTTGRTKFSCNNSLVAQPSFARPLAPGETWAVIATTGIRSESGEAATPSADMQLMLSDEAPADSAARDAWERYQPLRDYLAGDADLGAENIASASVFTVQAETPSFAAMRDEVRSSVPPALEDLTLCDEGVVSPCDDGETRVCRNATEGYIEIHARYDAPIFQRGTRPYLDPEDGGEIALADGQAQRQGSESMCVSLAIPTSAMPAEGWPVVMYAHGTGGSFLSHLQPSIAGALAGGDHGVTTDSRFITVGIDGVQHGPRRGDSELDPETLFFNFLNPAAARGNTEQGAADLFTLTYLLESLSLSAAASPTGEAIEVDADNIFFYGHSQGSNVGAHFAAWEESIAAAVFSGAGGGLTLSLLNKTAPVDIPQAIRFVLGEDVGNDHPLLNLLQTGVDPVDALHAAPLMVRERQASGDVDILHVSGVGDTYTPESTQGAFDAAGRFPIVGEELFDTPAQVVTAPQSANLDGRSAGAVHFPTPEGSDGHFVSFRDQQAIDTIVRFFVSRYEDGRAEIAP